MKRFLTTLAVSLIIVQLSGFNGSVFYVKAGSNGNGDSWSTAFGDLNQALALAEEGDQIWVAKGIYHPTNENDRNASFRITSGIEIYGGFAGHEKDIYARNAEYNTTVLSGEIGDPNSKEDNSYSVVYVKDAGEATIIDGFTITGGYANGTGEKGDVTRGGGGMFNDGSDGMSNPTVQNCIFKSNYGRDGAAIYNYAFNGEASATIMDCSFIFNKADLDGGAINNNGNYGVCNPVIKDCTFTNNEATYGAGILNQAEYGETRPLIVYCDFSGNTSYIEGSSVYNFSQGNGTIIPIIKNCSFKDNISSLGSEIGGSTSSSSINNDIQIEPTKSPLKLRAGGR